MVESKTPLGLRQRYDTEVRAALKEELGLSNICLLYTSPSPRDS